MAQSSRSRRAVRCRRRASPPPLRWVTRRRDRLAVYDRLATFPPLNAGLRATDRTDSGLQISPKRLPEPIVRKPAANRHGDDGRLRGITRQGNRDLGRLAKPHRIAIVADSPPQLLLNPADQVFAGGADGIRNSRHVPSSCHGSFHQRKTPSTRGFPSCILCAFASRRAASIGVLAVLSNHRAPAPLRMAE